MSRARKNFPHSFFWGLAIVVVGVPSALADGITVWTVVVAAMFAALGGWLVWRGWGIAQKRPLR